MPRMSITLTDSQNAKLEQLAKETGASKQSMIGLAISDWLSHYELPTDEAEGWYGWAEVSEPDPLSGIPYTYGVGYDGPYDTQEEAAAYAAKIAASNIEDGLDATAHVSQVIHRLAQ